MRIKCFLIQLCVIFPLMSQEGFTDVIDSLLQKSHQKFSEFQFVESSELANEALELSVSQDYSEGKVMASLYIVKVLDETGLHMEAVKYLDDIDEEDFFKNNIIPQVEYHRLKGRVYGSQDIYTHAKKEFNQQLRLSDQIADPKKRELSKLWAYQNIEQLFSMQSLYDSIEVYQDLQAKQLDKFEENELAYTISALHANKGMLYLNTQRVEEADEELYTSLNILDQYNIPYKYRPLRLLGDMKALKGNVDSALFYYNSSLENSLSLKVSNITRSLHDKIAEYLFENDTLIDKAKEHRRKYTVLNDSLSNHNKMINNAILNQIVKDKDKSFIQKNKVLTYSILVLIGISILIVVFLIVRNYLNHKKLTKTKQRLSSKTEQIEVLEEELENNIFNEIIKLAKNNSPEFLTLFTKGYPEFVTTMKKLDPTIRSSELYFCALAYLNFSTKDIASYTFVTVGAVQVRKNRMRKKYNIPSDVDFNEWFRNLVN